jgi:hypothetical protein
VAAIEAAADRAAGSYPEERATAMSNVVESLPAEMRSLFIDVIGSRNAKLLSSLVVSQEPNKTERLGVHDILTSEFSRCLQPDHEPSERGRAVDNLLGQFLLRWPILLDL